MLNSAINAKSSRDDWSLLDETKLNIPMTPLDCLRLGIYTLQANKARSRGWKVYVGITNNIAQRLTAHGVDCRDRRYCIYFEFSSTQVASLIEKEFIKQYGYYGDIGGVKARFVYAYLIRPGITKDNGMKFDKEWEEMTDMGRLCYRKYVASC